MQQFRQAALSKIFKFRVGNDMRLENFTNVFYTGPELQYMYQFIVHPEKKPTREDIAMFYQVLGYNFAPYVQDNAENYDQMTRFVLGLIQDYNMSPECTIDTVDRDAEQIFTPQARKRFQEQFKNRSNVKIQERMVVVALRKYIRWRLKGVQYQYELAHALHNQLLCDREVRYGMFQDTEGNRPLYAEASNKNLTAVDRLGRTIHEKAMYRALFAFHRQQDVLMKRQRQNKAIPDITELFVVPFQDIQHEESWVRIARALAEPKRTDPHIITNMQWFARAVVHTPPNDKVQYTARKDLLAALNEWRISQGQPAYTQNSISYKYFINELRQRRYEGKERKWIFTLKPVPIDDSIVAEVEDDDSDSDDEGVRAGKRLHRQAFSDELEYSEEQLRIQESSLVLLRARITKIRRILNE